MKEEQKKKLSEEYKSVMAWRLKEAQEAKNEEAREKEKIKAQVRQFKTEERGV